MTIKLYKLTSGEEIIGSIVKDASDHVELTDAVTLVYHQLEGGKMSAGFAPFMPYSEGNIKVKLQSICGESDVKAQLLDEYKRIFSPIIQPRSGLSGMVGI
jgi:hypothetical protein